MNWTESHIKKLKEQGKIAGYTVAKKKAASPIPANKSKGLLWLDLNLQHFAYEKGLDLGKEHQFDTDRKWRFDYAFVSHKIAVEFEGGIYMARSGHNTATHYTKDTEKYNRAAVLGWRVIRVTAKNYKTATDRLRELLP